MSILRRLAFNVWYFRSPPWDTGISPPELYHFIDLHPPGRALDVGCGTGTNVITLAKHGWQVTGVDYAIRAIRSARRKVRQAGVKAALQAGDVTRLKNIPVPFDLILDIGCYHGLNQVERQVYLENIERWLSPSGTFLTYVFYKKDAQHEGPGLNDQDLIELTNRFVLVNQQNGTERGQNASTWLTFTKKQSTSLG
jgi:cyclopropane fatty-acyl-phospholipid synthase-like methyltransferase